MNAFAAIAIIWIAVLTFVAYMVTTTGNPNWAWLIVLPSLMEARREK